MPRGLPNTSYQPAFLRGNPLRFVFAKSTNCCSLIEFTIWRDAPLRLAFDRSPRLAASAAPAAICCFFDLAGIFVLHFTEHCLMDARIGSQSEHRRSLLHAGLFDALFVIHAV